MTTSTPAGLPAYDSVQRVSAVDVVRTTLRKAILRGDLAGGAELVQTEIAAHLGVSTTPVREAMRDLSSEGLITLVNNRKGIVRSLDWEEMTEIVMARQALERLAIEMSVARITPEELAAARALAEELAEITDIGTWVEKNTRFHTIFHEASRTKRLSVILRGLEEAAGIYVAQAQLLRPELRSRAASDHFKLIEAYERKDAAAAVEIQIEHLKLPLGSPDQ